MAKKSCFDTKCELFACKCVDFKKLRSRGQADSIAQTVGSESATPATI